MSQQNGGIRINKYLANAGYCSRQQADELIKKRKVFIDNRTAKLGDEVAEGDQVRVDKRIIKLKSKHVYILLNKPKGIVCTTDQKVKNNIVDHVNFKQRIFPVGRLDQMSEGLIILTSDGNIVNKILRSENEKEKEYLVKVNKAVTEDFLKKMAGGVNILGRKTKPARVQKHGEDGFRIILTEGMNRQIRRMCEKLGYFVKSLKRVRIMHLEIKGIKPGQWRFLTGSEVAKLQGSESRTKSN